MRLPFFRRRVDNELHLLALARVADVTATHGSPELAAPLETVARERAASTEAAMPAGAVAVPPGAGAAEPTAVRARERMGGWVPRVPSSARSHGSDGSSDPGGAAPEPDATVGDRALTADPTPATQDPAGRAASPPGGRHAGRRRARGRRAVAVAEWMPLPVRSAWQRITPGSGVRLELGRAHVAVVGVVVAAGLGLAVAVYMLGRPQVVPVEAGMVAGSPAPEAGTADVPAVDDGAAEDSAAQDGGAAQDGAAAEAGRSAEDGPAARGGVGADKPPIIVHVAGKVREPGIVELPAGSRVVDALDAAGGVTDEVDLTPLNLARVLADGEQVLVGVQAPADSGQPAGQAPEEAADGTDPQQAPVDINVASGAELEALPGIGPTLAGRIIDWRTRNGQFTSAAELQEISGIGPSILAEIEPLVTL